VNVDASRLDEVRAALNSLPGMSTLVDLREINAEVQSYLALLYIFVSVMLFFGAFMAFALVFNTSTINILERELEIATMRTLGTPNWKISVALTLENLLMGMLGLVPGFVAAYIVMAHALGLYQTDYFSFSLSIFPISYLLASCGVLTVMVLSELPPLVYVRRMDLAQSVKRRAT
jgi:putative ABC transport system permease protein